MEEKIFKEIILTIGPFTLKILGNAPQTYFFRVRGTETDSFTVSEVLAEISRHILALKKLREAVEEDV